MSKYTRGILKNKNFSLHGVQLKPDLLSKHIHLEVVH